MNYSRQREAILDFLRSMKVKHPSADAVYVNVKKRFPNISLGTVYRNLNLLADNGTIAKVKLPSDADRFDHNTEPHFHIICENCGQIEDVGSALVNIDVVSIEKLSGFSVNAGRIVLKGLCPACRKKLSPIKRKDNKK